LSDTKLEPEVYFKKMNEFLIMLQNYIPINP